MNLFSDLFLFPKNEDWGTGDEALDVRLTSGLKKAIENLSLESIAEFYAFGLNLKTRAYNPAFSVTIEQVSKALLFHLHPDECNDVLYKKMRGHYFQKERVSFYLENAASVVAELKSKHKFRYKEQIDFLLSPQATSERNPFVQNEMKKAPYDLMVKIIFKDLRQYLSGEVIGPTYDDPFFLALKSGKNVLAIENFSEIWFHDNQLFALSLCQWN